MSLDGLEDALRTRGHDFTHLAEVILHIALAILLVIGAAAALWTACHALLKYQSSDSSQSLAVLDQLLLVLIFVEVLHTVRISILSESLLMEPFLIVGVMASVRRVLLITMQAAQTVQHGQVDEQSRVLFRNSMVELGLLGMLILILVASILLCRRMPESTSPKVAQ